MHQNGILEIYTGHGFGISDMDHKLCGIILAWFFLIYDAIFKFTHVHQDMLSSSNLYC